MNQSSSIFKLTKTRTKIMSHNLPKIDLKSERLQKILG